MPQDDIVLPLWRWVEFVLGANLIQIGEDMMEFFFYLHFNGLFFRWTWVSRCLLKQRMVEVGNNWSYRSCKSPVKSSPPTNQHPLDALPVAQPTVSKHWREKCHIPWTCLPQAHLEVFQLCLWPLIASGYLGGGLPCLSSTLWWSFLKVNCHINCIRILNY